jgi:hypothetical protein
VGKPYLARTRAGYREVKRVIRHGPSYPWRRYVAPARILKGIRIHTEEAADMTVCALTSRHDWLMCLWALVSFYKFSGVRLPLLIYSDGSLKSHHAERIRSVFPNARIVDPATADAAVAGALAHFPNCRQFRLLQPCARRIIDLPILCKSKSMLMLDSDVLFFRRPEELMKYLNGGRGGNFVFERDPQDSYFDSRENICRNFDVDIAPRVNCGIMIADIANFDYPQIEKWLGNDAFLKKHHWAEQGLWAMYAGEARATFLSEPYDVNLSAEIAPNAVMKHYIKPIRDFIYTSGIPHLSRCLEQPVY